LEKLTFSESSSRFRIRTTLLFLKIFLSITVVILVSIFLFELLFGNTALGIEPKSIYFSEEINISKNNGTSELPQVTAEGNNVYVVWQDNTNGNYDVYFKSSSTNGTKFKSIRNLSKNNGTSELPQIASTKDLFYVFWKDDANGMNSAYFKEGRKEGSATNTEFGSSKRILNTGNVSKPQLTIGGNIFSSIWTSNSAVNSSIIKFYPLGFFDDSTDAIQLTKSSPNEKISSVSITGYDAGIYFVWENMKISTSDIFFKRMSGFPDD
jgi:hypothetical protein